MRYKKVVALCFGVSLLGACGVSGGPSSEHSSAPEPSSSVSSDTQAQEPQVQGPQTPGTALEMLETLEVKGRAPKTGYERELFGASWADVDNDGCDTRNQILQLSLRNPVVDPNCKVQSGLLDDPYSGKTLDWVKGGDVLVDIDHVVALSDAWQKGAQSWEASTRLNFANDPLNLLAVDGPLNRQKSDGDAATWLPPNKSYRCDYVARQVGVKSKYQLWVTQAEKDAIGKILEACPGFQAVTQSQDGPIELAPPVVEDVMPDASLPSANPHGAKDPQYGSCKEVKKAGLGPYKEGLDAEYDWYIDGDADGLVCE